MTTKLAKKARKTRDPRPVPAEDPFIESTLEEKAIGRVCNWIHGDHDFTIELLAASLDTTPRQLLRLTNLQIVLDRFQKMRRSRMNVDVMGARADPRTREPWEEAAEKEEAEAAAAAGRRN